MYHFEDNGSLSIDDGDTELYLMQLRDAHQESERRFGECEDSYATCAPFIDGDPLRERNEAFLSRPLRMKNPIRRDEDDFGIYQDMYDEVLRRGF